MRVGRCTIFFLLCTALGAGVFHAAGTTLPQDVKSTYDKSANFAKFRKYTWGQNYLLTMQPKDVQEMLDMAIEDAINRRLKAGGFVEDDEHPDFMVIFEAGSAHNVDIGAQRYFYAADFQHYYFNGEVTGISSDAWSNSLASMKITVTNAATKDMLWQATATKKIQQPKKFIANLHENLDKFIQKTMKTFPPKS